MLTTVVNAVSAKSGGAATYVENLARELASRDGGRRYLFYVPSGRAQRLNQLGSVEVAVETDIGYRSPWRRLLWDQITLRRLIRRNATDVLLSSSDFGMWFPPCRQVLMVRNPLFFSRLYLQTVLPRKSLGFKLQFFIRRWLISLSVRSSDVVITATRSMMSDVKRFISVPDGKAVVNHFGVPLDRFEPCRSADARNAAGDPRRPFRVLYVSEYSDYKNLTTLLKALLLLVERGVRDVRLVTTADPSQFPGVEISTRAEDMALASSSRIKPFVTFTGTIPYEQIRNLYAQSDLLVFPSLAESFGHPLVEAMASGVPILASDIPVHREICEDAAEYFSPQDPADLADGIARLRSDSERRQRLGELGAGRARALFDWKDHVRRLVGILEDVAGSREAERHEPRDS